MGNILKDTNIRRIDTNLLVAISFLLVIIGVFARPSGQAQAASLSVSPAAGTFTVGSTFDVSVFLNTEGETINAVRTFLSFPPDKLQLLSKGAGSSIIAVYTSPPRFDNQAGIVDLQGGIPGGVNVSSGLVTTFTFRVRSVGTAILRFRDESTVFLNDGQGTEVLRRKQDGVYEFILPPPAGPIVASPTHPEQGRWYQQTTATLTWVPENSAITAYSYVLNVHPTDTPDDTPEGSRTSVTYQNLGDGLHYFHIKALRQGVWGGVTHFAINIDSSPPAGFPIEIVPGKRTARIQPIIQFATTDNLSGLDHYEIKLFPLSPGSGTAQGAEDVAGPLFIEVQSPYVTPILNIGSYDVIVRAYDKTGNYREVSEKLKIVSNVFEFVSDRGLEVRSNWIVPWLWFWIILAVLLGFLGYLAWRLNRWHKALDLKKVEQKYPDHIDEKLTELQKYREKYGKIAVLFLALALSFLVGSRALAQEVEFSPPVITAVSRNITNEEIFYAGGVTETAGTKVVIYLQNLRTGATISREVVSDKKGEWFYRHDSFLTSGDYFLWAQSLVGESSSPPSPQIRFSVVQTALQFGSSRISLAALYLMIIVVLFLAALGLLIYVIQRARHGRRKHQELLKEIREAEESVRRGFAVLRRDIQAELAVIRQAKLSKALSEQEQERERVLLKDLDDVEKYIGQEIWEVEQSERA